MSTDELMMPRYKVINIWPDMGNYGHYQGQVITMVKLNNGEIGWPTFKVTFYPAHFENYPHLFKKLEWWEGRKPEEMPLYVKWNYNPKTDNEDVKGLVEKVIKWVQDGHGVVTSGSMVIATCHWLPATLAEYENYINQKENQ